MGHIILAIIIYILLFIYALYKAINRKKIPWIPKQSFLEAFFTLNDNFILTIIFNSYNIFIIILIFYYLGNLINKLIY